jgi:hypothetical protein
MSREDTPIYSALCREIAVRAAETDDRDLWWLLRNVAIPSLLFLVVLLVVVFA